MTTKQQPDMQPNTRFFRHLALTSYLLLCLWIVVWYLVLDAANNYSLVFVSLFWFAPLAFPAKGIIQGNPYTHAWANFIVMIYFMHGLTDIYANSAQWYYALIEIVLSTGMLVGCCFYARLRGRELGLGLKKLKDESE